MNIPQTIKAMQDLARTPSHGPADDADDLDTAEYLLATCQPPLAAAAFEHLMAQFHHLRAQANA